MKAYIWSNGDPSVGIFGFSTEVEIGFDAQILDEDDLRQSTRKLLQECFAEIWDDGSTTVVFEDENND